MALYDRDYVNNAERSEHVAAHEGNRAAFIKKTYQLFAASLLAATVGAYIGMGLGETVRTWFWGFVILELALLFGLYAVKRKEGVNYLVLFAFTFVSGLTLAPLLGTILALSGGANIVTNAFLMTTVAFGGLSVYAMNTDTDFSSWGKPLFIVLIAVIVVSLANAFFFNSPILQLAVAGISSLLFSAFILYDTQNIIRGAYETPIEGAVALYLDFLNLFISLLQIMGILGSDD
jgi:modulator of FtsH protease